MTDEAAFHEGYRKALEQVTRLLAHAQKGGPKEFAEILKELDRRIERARCLGRSSLASGASGDMGY